MEVESGRRREFESKLAETMQQLREDHTFQLHQYKEEMEKTFSTKVLRFCWVTAAPVCP